MASKATTLQKAFLREVGKLKGDIKTREQVCGYLTSQGLDINCASWSPTPFLLTKAQYEKLVKDAEIMAGIMEKLMAKYHRDRSFRALFNLTPEVEELTLVPSGCRRAVPLVRLDVFYDQKTGDFKICGIVTGGIDGMASAVEANRATGQTASWHAFRKSHEAQPPFDVAKECVSALLETYAAWANAQEGYNHPTQPSLAIVDFKGSVRSAETAYMVSRLREMGYFARATDPSELSIKRVGDVDQLVDDHGPVTCIWLRPLVHELAERESEGVRALIDATRHGMVCTVGGYRSWPSCTRNFLSVLRSKECRMLLSMSENAFVEAHVPDTYVLDTSSNIARFYDQENWILKTADSHAPADMIAGASITRSAWRNRLVKGIKRHDAVQPYLTQYQLDVLPPLPAEGEDPCATTTKNLMLGLYLFEGSLKGIRASCGTGLCIADWDDRQELGCFVMES